MKITINQTSEKPVVNHFPKFMIDEKGGFEERPTIIFATAKDGKYLSGYFVNGNNAHEPFKYFSSHWTAASFVEFRGSLTIECP